MTVPLDRAIASATCIPRPRQEPAMSAPLYPLEDHTDAELGKLAEFDAAEEPEEVTVERIVDALYGVKWPDGEPLLHMARTHTRKLAVAALTALRGDRAPLAGQHTTGEEGS